MLAERSLRRGTEIDHRELASLRQWFPVSLDQSPQSVWWRFAGERRFIEPFFEDSLKLQAPQDRRVCRTPLAVLEQPLDCVLPTAFIFHVSRCGSTLLTQMLAALPQCIVMSEPPVLDAFFRLHHHQPGQGAGVHTLRGLVAALGQRRLPQERYFFIKFDSWHMPWMPLVRQAFPDTPIVLLYRDPGQVLLSHQRQRGAQMVPGLVDTTRLRPDVVDLAPGDLDGYAGRVLDALFDEALRTLPGGRPRLVNYDQLPAVLWADLIPGWSLDVLPGDLLQLKARAGFHSKRAGASFAGDSAVTDVRLEKDMGCRSAAHSYALLEAQRISCATERCLPSQ